MHIRVAKCKWCNAVKTVVVAYLIKGARSEQRNSNLQCISIAMAVGTLPMTSL